MISLENKNDHQCRLYLWCIQVKERKFFPHGQWSAKEWLDMFMKIRKSILLCHVIDKLNTFSSGRAWQAESPLFGGTSEAPHRAANP